MRFRNNIRVWLLRRRNPLRGVVGCVTGLLILACGVLVVGLVFGLMRSSAVYKQALAEVQAHPDAIRALGEPIKPGLFLNGSISASKDSGAADFEIPVSGSRDKGTVYVTAVKAGGEWQLTTLELTTKKYPDRIDLLRER